MRMSTKASRLLAVCVMLVPLSFAPLTMSPALADEAAGSISAIDFDARTITLDDGTVFVLADELDPEGLEVGNEVLLTYTEGDNGTLFVSLIEITE